jgi:UDP-2,4-diacetamido-2,4,6-trideoxy-beta-L-altropyranose hydrolase|tara:strand:- start:898 stop:1917 length:1020 start_codon:yes stop_codon:yes gene_type:complete
MKKEYDFVIRCITQSKKGFGNLNRCLIIAQILKKKKFNVLFVIDKNLHAKNIIETKKFSSIVIDSSDIETKSLKKIMMNTNSHFLLLDMREFGEKISKSLLSKDYSLIVFDDAWCKKIYADILFNGTIIKKYHKYKKINQKSKIFLGSKFWISDKNFSNYRKSSLSIKNKKQYVVTLSLGGADPSNVTFLILNELLKIPSIKINVIIGPFFDNQNWIKSFSDSSSVNIITNEFKLWKIFDKSDLVICSAGNTLFDLAIQGVPNICIPIVKHQIPYAKWFDSNKISIKINLNKKSIKQMSYTVQSILSDTNKRKIMNKMSKSIFDGQGSKRTVNKILKSF